MRQRQRRVEQDGEVHAGAGGGDERASETAAAAGLLLCREHKAVRPVEILLLHDRVGRGDGGHDDDFPADAPGLKQRPNACGGQAVVIAGETVALAGHAVDGEAVRTQRADGLVHRRTRHAERLREPPARKPFAARLLERREHLVLHCHEYVHPSQTDFLSHLL